MNLCNFIKLSTIFGHLEKKGKEIKGFLSFENVFNVLGGEFRGFYHLKSFKCFSFETLKKKKGFPLDNIYVMIWEYAISRFITSRRVISLSIKLNFTHHL